MTGWIIEQNADDNSWEAWSPGREWGSCTIPLDVIDQLRAKEVRG